MKAEWIDLQINGYGGIDFNSPGLTVEPVIAAGAKAYTHLGNGIPNMIPRHGNVIFTALADDRVSVMFIPDGHHLPDSVLKVFTREECLKIGRDNPLALIGA